MKIGKIAVGIDFSDESEGAVARAVELAGHTGAELLLVHVGSVALPSPPSVLPSVQEWENFVNAKAAESQSRLQALEDAAKAKGLACSSLIVEGEAAEKLVEAAEACESDLLIVGSHGRGGATHFLLGSVAERVVRIASCNVLVSRPGASFVDGPKRILLATDFSPHAEVALEVAMDLAGKGGRIDIVHAWDVSSHAVPVVSPDVEAGALAALGERFESLASEQGAALLEKYEDQGEHLSFEAIEGRAATAVVDKQKQADLSYDLVIVGSHGRRGFKRFFLGSVAEKIVRFTTCSTMVVHRNENH